MIRFPLGSINHFPRFDAEWSGENAFISSKKVILLGTKVVAVGADYQCRQASLWVEKAVLLVCISYYDMHRQI